MSTGVKISELTAASTFTGSETFPVVQSSTTVKGTPSQITDYVAQATATLINKTINGLNNTFVNVPLATAVTGTLAVSKGGTGLSSYTAGTLLYASAATTIAALATTASGKVLVSGSAPVWGAADLSTAVTGTLAVINGGTGVVTYGTGDMLYASASTTLAKLAATATSFVLLSGTAPSWGKVNMANAVTGTLAIANGGTAATTAAGIITSVFGGSTGTGNVVLASSPALITPALGTPASGVLDNCTATTKTQVTNSTALASTAYVDRVAVQQVARYETGALATGTTTIPWDDTIPQITEGDQYMSLSITPKSATSKLLIIVDAKASVSNTAQGAGMALFKVGTNDAIGIGTVTVNVGWLMTFSCVAQVTSGSTSSQTFTVRMGPQGGVGGTITFNGSGGSRLYGGALVSSITIMEIGV